MQLSDRGTVLSAGLGLLRNGQGVSGIISGVRIGGEFTGLFSCLPSGIILLGVILDLVLRPAILLSDSRR